MSSTSQRASALVQPMPAKDQLISERFRLVAKAWVDADAAARLLEDTRSSVFSKAVLKMQMTAASNAQAEHMARASDEYQEHLTAAAKARDLANLRKVQMEYVWMQFTEWQMATAASRDEKRMSR